MHFRSSLLFFLATSLVSASAWATFFQSSSDRHDNLSKLKFIVFETDELSTSLRTFLNVANKYGVEATVLGKGSTFNGFGSKYEKIHETLDQFKDEDDALVAVLDGRDILLNIAQNVAMPNFQSRIKAFIETFKDMMDGKPNAVMISAEQQCCVAALCHADSPAAYFDPATGKRAQRACSSGDKDCGWVDNDNVKFWQSLMIAEAYSQTETNQQNAYLNAGMMLGTAKNLINMIERMDIGEEEDDQAILSAMYLQHPELIVLDYEQKLLGNNAWPKGLEEGCLYDFDQEKGMSFLTNTQTGTSPLILHTPGKFYDCLDVLIDKLGGKSDKRYMDKQTSAIVRQLNYGVSSTSVPVEETIESEFEDDEDDEPKGNSMALTWGISCAAAAAIVAGFVTKHRMVATRDQHTARLALMNSEEAFSLGEAGMSDGQSSVHEQADPDDIDIVQFVAGNASPTQFEEIPIHEESSILSSTFEHCDDLCAGRKKVSLGEQDELRSHNSVHW